MPLATTAIMIQYAMPASPPNLKAECSATRSGAASPITMWKSSQCRVVPMLAEPGPPLPQRIHINGGEQNGGEDSETDADASRRPQLAMQRMKRPVGQRQQIVAQPDGKDIEKNRQQSAGQRRDRHSVQRDRLGFLGRGGQRRSRLFRPLPFFRGGHFKPPVAAERVNVAPVLMARLQVDDGLQRQPFRRSWPVAGP